MPHTRASHETSQNTSQSLEVADILARQHKAKNLAQAQQKGKTGSQPVSTISKPPSSSKSSGDEAAPPETDTLSQCVSPMPSWVSHHTSHSRSPSPTPSTTQQLDAPLQHAYLYQEAQKASCKLRQWRFKLRCTSPCSAQKAKQTRLHQGSLPGNPPSHPWLQGLTLNWFCIKLHTFDSSPSRLSWSGCPPSSRR